MSPAAPLTIALPKRIGIKVAIATNQSGLVRGYFTLPQVHLLHVSIEATVQSEGGRIDAYGICPYLIGGTVAEYAVDCGCRKLKSGLIKQLLAKFQASPEFVAIIGDRKTDLLAGQAAEVNSFVYDGKDLFEFTKTVISAYLDSGAVNSAEVTSMAVRG